MRQYPIWNIITACIYNSAKSYGVKNTGEVEIRAGTSSKNSHVFLKHCTTHRQHENGDKEFRFYVDGQLIKRAVLHKGESELQFFDGSYPADKNFLDARSIKLIQGVKTQ